MRHFIVAASGIDYYIIYDDDWASAKARATIADPGWRAIFSNSFFDPSIFSGMCLGVIK